MMTTIDLNEGTQKDALAIGAAAASATPKPRESQKIQMVHLEHTSGESASQDATLHDHDGNFRSKRTGRRGLVSKLPSEGFDGQTIECE